MKHTCDNLRQGATRQVTDYERRFSVLKDAYDGLLVNLIKSGFNPKEAWETAKEFFGSESIRFAGIDGKCSQHVETLLRQGRTYGLGVCIATQRIAYLNTNALQQLHTYFVGTLPRPYDRDW
jgi:hypothetical protein